jgi:hypothetical protein
VSNSFATSSIVAKTALEVLKNQLVFSTFVSRDWETEFTSNMSRGYAPGQTILIKQPPRFLYRAGPVAAPQGIVQSTVPVTISQGGVDIAYSTLERTVSIVQLQDILRAAMAPVTNEIDRQGLQMARFATANLLNPLGALPTTQLQAVQVLTDVNTRLDQMSAPVKDGRRYMVMSPGLNGATVAGYSGLFNQSDKIDGQYRTGYMQKSFGIMPGMDQNVVVHANGAATATNISGANQTGSSITVVAVAGGTLTRGTVIQLPGVNSVNPQTRETTGVAMDFVVTADVALGATSIPISPAIVTTGAFQNVTASPTSGSPYVIRGNASTSYLANVGFHADAFTLAMVPLYSPPKGGVVDVSEAEEDGFRLRVITFYDGVNDSLVTRVDVAFGWAAPYPQLAAKYYTVS